MNVRLNRDKTVAIDAAYFWQPMSSAPLGVKIPLLPSLGVALYSQYTGDPKGWDGWAPLPKRRPDAGQA